MTSLASGGLSSGSLMLTPGPLIIAMLEDMGWNDTTAIGLNTNPTSITTSCVVGSSPTQQRFELWADSGLVSYSIQSDTSNNWWTCTPSSGSATIAHSTITVSYNSVSLPAGTYNSTINIKGTNGEAAYVALTLVVNSSETGSLKASPESISVKTAVGSDAASTSFNLYTTAGTVTYSITTDSEWMTCSPTSGTATTTQSQIGVKFSTSTLEEGSYTGTISVAGGDGSTIAIGVSLVVGSTTGGFYSSVDSLQNTCAVGSEAVPQTFQIWSDSVSLSYAITGAPTWLKCTPSSGNLVAGMRQTINVYYPSSTLTAGAYAATLAVTGTASSGKTITLSVSVKLIVGASLSVSPTSLAQTSGVSADASPQSLQVWNAGTGSLSFSVTSDATWLTCIPTSGASTGAGDIVTVDVLYGTSALAVGTYTAKITIRTGNASDTTAIGVTLKILDTPVVNVSANIIDLSKTTSFLLTNSGTGDMSYSVQDDQLWMSVTPTSGTLASGASTKVDISYTTVGLPIGLHKGLITVTGTDSIGKTAFNSPSVVECDLQLGPADVTTDGLVALIAGDNDGITVNSKGMVSFCPDLSGSIDGASQRSKSKQPLLYEDTLGLFNGYPAFSFNQKSNLLLPSTSKINSAGPYDEKTVCIVFRSGTDVAKRQILYEEGGKKSGLNIYVANSTLYMGAWNTKNKQGVTTWGPMFLSTGISSQSLYVAIFVLDQPNGTMTGYLNGSIFSSVTGAGELSGDPEQGSIGGINKTTQYNSTQGATKGFGGYVAEFWYYNNALAATDVASLYNYMKTKYGLK